MNTLKALKEGKYNLCIIKSLTILLYLRSEIDTLVIEVILINCINNQRGLGYCHYSLNYYLRICQGFHRPPIWFGVSYGCLISTNFYQKNVENSRHDKPHLIFHTNCVFYGLSVRRSVCESHFSFGRNIPH